MKSSKFSLSGMQTLSRYKYYNKMNKLIKLLWLTTFAYATQPKLNLTSFSKEMFWDEPPEGLFQVDIGL